MSQSSSISISCPECGHGQEFTTWSSLNVSLDPDKKTELINGSLTRFTCEQCGESSEVNYPILFHDPDHKFMIWLNGDKDDSAMKSLLVGDFLNGYQLRLVESRNHLVEKSHIFEVGLDDRVMELFKATMRAAPKGVPEGELLFAGMGKGQNDVEELQFAVLAETGTKFIGTTRNAFEDFAQEFVPFLDHEPLEQGMWHRVGQPYANDMLARYLPNSGE